MAGGERPDGGAGSGAGGGGDEAGAVRGGAVQSGADGGWSAAARLLLAAVQLRVVSGDGDALRRPGRGGGPFGQPAGGGHTGGLRAAAGRHPGGVLPLSAHVPPAAGGGGAGPAGGGAGQPGQERVSLQHEPRHPHPHECHRRHDRHRPGQYG